MIQATLIGNQLKITRPKDSDTLEFNLYFYKAETDQSIEIDLLQEKKVT